MSKYRVFVGSIQQETNSFSPARSKLSDFDRAEGPAVFEKLAMEPLLRRDVECIPGIYANAVPAGPMRREVFDSLLRDLLRTLDPTVDGVFLYLHGALDVEGLGSGDAEILRAVREAVGKDAKIAVAMDFHANVSPVLLSAADVACAYRTAPHVDMEDTQLRACHKLIEMLESGRRPFGCMVRVPMLFTGDCVITENEPARGLMEMMKKMEREPGIFHMSLCFGQPWADTRWVGTSILCYADSEERAREAAQALGLAWWDARRRFRFLTETCLPEEAFELVKQSDRFPVFLSDSGDNTTAGAAGDRAGMLRLAVASGQRVLVAGLTDDRAVKMCYNAAVGSTLHLTLGGTLDERHSDIFEGDFELLRVSDILGWYGENAGRCAVLRIGKVDVIVTENRCAVTAQEIPASVGVDIMEYPSVVVKLGYLWPKLQAIAPRAIFVMSDGASTARIERIAYQHAPKPYYPVNEEMEYDVQSLTIVKEPM